MPATSKPQLTCNKRTKRAFKSPRPTREAFGVVVPMLNRFIPAHFRTQLEACFFCFFPFYCVFCLGTECCLLTSGALFTRVRISRNKYGLS